MTPPRIGQHTEARFSYDYAHSRGNYLYTVVPGGPLPAPSQLPEVFNKLQELKLDVRHRLSNRLVATFSYLYEPFDVYDFAFDPSVVDSIVQPSSLVLGYVYRPYTAHSAGVRPPLSLVGCRSRTVRQMEDSHAQDARHDVLAVRDRSRLLRSASRRLRTPPW